MRCKTIIGRLRDSGEESNYRKLISSVDEGDDYHCGVMSFAVIGEDDPEINALIGCQRHNKRSDDLYPCKAIHIID